MPLLKPLVEDNMRELVQNGTTRTKNAAAYRAQKLQATPIWADLEAIQWVYSEAQRLSEKTGTKHTVDHYYPLVSDIMCGLHVENNLQILTLSENSSKRNSIPE